MKITGKIHDSNNEPLGLANITIINGERANRLGAIADFNGYFELDNDLINPESIFVVTYMGFSPQTFKAADLVDANIKLTPSQETLDVVTVYGTPKIKVSVPTMTNFRKNLEKHKFVYAGIGGIVGLILIISSIKK